MNKFVYNISDVDKIAFGAIVDQETRDSWLWYKVEWPTVRPSNIYNNSNYDTETEWHRSDTVKAFDPDNMISQINATIS
jgi:hypothetical protein